MKCRHCEAQVTQSFLDLGYAPPSNAYLSAQDLRSPETYFPLSVLVCSNCWLAQTEDFAAAHDLFTSDYAYFSSTSTSWLEHASRYADSMTDRLRLNRNSLVIEVACNDGYLLKNFIAKGIPCIGIEPTASTATAAAELGIEVLREFFGVSLAERLVIEGRQADLIIANNVFAHVPDINDFSLGLARALKRNGTVTLEFPHLMRLIQGNQFDTVYHEHFSYLSLHTTIQILMRAGLRVWHVEELSTHGGSLRVFACHATDKRATTSMVTELLESEKKNGLFSLDLYAGFQKRADLAKDALLRFLIDAKQAGKSVAGYGAAAKGNTLLNYAGIKRDLLPFVCDAAKRKQGKFLPGSHIPILDPSAIEPYNPDYVLILPWNIAGEVKRQLRHIHRGGARFVTAIPALEVS